MERTALTTTLRGSALDCALIGGFRWLASGFPSYARGEHSAAGIVLGAALSGDLIEAHLRDAMTVIGEFQAIGVEPFEAPTMTAPSHRELLLLDAISALQRADAERAIERLAEVTDGRPVVGVLFSLRVLASGLRQKRYNFMTSRQRAFAIIEGSCDAAPRSASEKRARRTLLHCV